jgi:hypothetical protein
VAYLFRPVESLALEARENTLAAPSEHRGRAPGLRRRQIADRALTCGGDYSIAGLTQKCHLWRLSRRETKASDGRFADGIPAPHAEHVLV